MKISDFNISMKLYAGFGVVILIFCLSNLYQIVNTANIQDLNYVAYQHIERDLELHEISLRMERSNTILTSSIINMHLPTSKMEEIENICSSDLKKLNEIITTEEEKALVKQFGEKYEKMLTIFKQKIEPIFQEKETNKLEKLQPLNVELSKIGTEGVNIINKLTESFTQKTLGAKQVQEDSFKSGRTSLIIFSLFGLIIGAVLAYFTAAMILEPLNVMIPITNSYAEGNLTVELPVEGHDEIGKLADAFRQMIGNMSSLINKANFSAQTTAATSQEFSASSAEVVKSTEQVAVAVSDIANSSQSLSTLSLNTKGKTEELKSMVQAIASLINNISEEAIATNTLATTGQEAAAQAGQNMSTISSTVKDSARIITTLGEKSKEITKIIDLINGISEQTNLLALNAAIEAARAGDAGRGFAVVADEVRKLAVESKNATLKIEELIGEIRSDTEKAVQSINTGNNQVEEGSAVVNEALAALEKIGNNVSGLASDINTILETANEEVSIADEVQSAIDSVATTSQELAASTEEVSASVEQTTSAMEEVSAGASQLAKSAEELTQALATFKT